MSIYTYEINSNLFLKNLLDHLLKRENKTKDERKIINLISGADCKIIPEQLSYPIRPPVRITASDDIIKKGKEMVEVYFYFYCIENSLRLFIEKVALNKFGEDYFEKLQINSNIEKNIKGRKRKEEKNKWLSVRGDSELFYLDFEDLEKIIMNNWNLFRNYFPDQKWITSKLSEMADCRNLIAHNSFIDEDGRNLLRTYYVNILKQIANA